MSEVRKYRITYEVYSEANRLGVCDGFPKPFVKKHHIALYVPDPKLRKRYTHWRVLDTYWTGFTVTRSSVPPYYRDKIKELNA